MTTFYAGASETVTLTNTFKVNGVATDPTAGTLTITDPVSGTASSALASWAHPSTGSFAFNVACPTPGVWSYVWAVTGAVADVEHGSWTVLETSLGHLYATPEQIKSRVGINPGDAKDDAELHAACYAASRSIEQYCERRFWRNAVSAPEARVFRAVDFWTLDLGPWNDLVQVTQLATDENGDGTFETVWTTSLYELNPVNTYTGPEQRPYTSVRAVSGQAWPLVVSGLGRLNRVQITGVYGWPAVPAAITEATRLVAAQLFKLKDAPLGVAGFGEYGAVRVRENPIAAGLAAPYRAGEALA